ncbi:MAG TPA: acyl transferase [Chitinophagaceae bacterium]|jgi:phenylacetate-coenzyme A ligase PaaK-like adenylate-forming protein|nr:acyl transferase [Chitinophagaceae bacterium]HMU58370.1 acyl transferase [Chitinophagaceae bacterium]
MDSQWNHKIFNVLDSDFDDLAVSVYRYQYENNHVYRQFSDALYKNPDVVRSLEQVPYLPVSFFKSHQVMTSVFEPDIVFESSGTSATVNSRHLVRDISLYEKSFVKGFNRLYGEIGEWCVIGLLPSYLEKGNSSLVYMIDKLIQLSAHPDSGFYLYDFARLKDKLSILEAMNQKTLLVGVTYALLDFAELFQIKLRHTVVMETGGMKGRRKELLRDEVHKRLCKAFEVDRIHSEYGMTELLSQAYSPGNGVFSCPPWMKILVRDEEDPLTVSRYGKGVINVIDLANIYSCSFIATDDAGKLNDDGSFEVLGRTDGSDLRGCSLLTL